MFLLTYTVSNGHEFSSYDYHRERKTTSAIINGDAFTAKALRAVVDDVDVFNILMAQGNLRSLCKTFEGNVGLEEMAYIASCGDSFSQADMEELMLDLHYAEWVKEKFNKSTSKANLQRKRWIEKLIETEGLSATARKLTTASLVEIANKVSYYRNGTKNLVLDIGIIQPEDLEYKEVEAWLDRDAQVEAIMDLSRKCGKVNLIPVDEALSKEVEKWLKEQKRLLDILNESEENWNDYEAVQVSLRPFVLPREGEAVVIAESGYLSYCND